MKPQLALVAALASGCIRHPSPPPPAPSVPIARIDTADVPAHTEPDPAQQALALAWPEAATDRTAFDQLADRIERTRDDVLRRAWLFAAARRAPNAEIARLYALTRRDDARTLARGLAGRPVNPALTDLPRPLIDTLTASHPDPAAAAVVSRYHLRTPGSINVQTLLGAASSDDQLSGARLMASTSAPLPDALMYELMDPSLVPAVVRSLASRTDVPTSVWVGLLGSTAQRAALAPRRWGNAWRAVRSAAPGTVPEIRVAFEAAIAQANRAQGLPPATASWFQCENAAALDKLTGWPAATLNCAAEGHAWIALASQADVLGSSTDQPGRRADALARLIAAAQGQPQVLEAVATAAVGLPVAATGAVVRRLARERDPGVEAALLEALLLHVQQASALPETARHDLLHAPFEQPEGPSLEARVQAIALARRLHADADLPPSPVSTVRAIRLALAPDAGVAMLDPRPPAPREARTRLRVATDAGPFEITLEPEAAPDGVATLLDAVRARRYDGLDFHRVVPGFVAQGGDPRGDGYGGTDQPTPTELSFRPFERGAVGVPLAGLDTGGIQFFIVLADAPHLDGRYPWLGRVTRGLEVIDGLLPGDRILGIEIQPAP